jgi:hypothetical protein
VNISWLENPVQDDFSKQWVVLRINLLFILTLLQELCLAEGIGFLE